MRFIVGKRFKGRWTVKTATAVAGGKTLDAAMRHLEQQLQDAKRIGDRDWVLELQAALEGKE